MTEKNNRHNTEVAQLYPDEIAHLDDINQKLDDALKQADSSIDRADTNFSDVKNYMVEHNGDIDPHEMFQNEMALKQLDRTGVFAVKTRDKITRQLDSPYFARIDFGWEDDDEIIEYYIGRFAFSHNHDLLIFDWRAPIASMYYDCEVGPASYAAPMGKISGNLTCKRQFKIKRGELEYVLESSANIQDDVLQRELSQTSDEKMKSIISTIQKEQNQIIRNDEAKTLIIQGVAGSGKTSIALHRIAFLLYRYKDKLNADNITILSPNKVFGDYISNVLPELGEEPIFELNAADIAKEQLEGYITFEAAKDPLERKDELWAQRDRFKSDVAFVRQVDDYLREMPARIFGPADYSFGQFTVNKGWIQKRYEAYFKHPVKKRLEMVADDIFDRFKTENIRGHESPTIKSIVKQLIGMLTKKTTLALYEDLYKQMGSADMLYLPGKNKLEWIDVYPFMYVHEAFEGLKENLLIRHLVIDEMQDYTPLQFALINKLFKCQKTILGDFGQNINPNYQHTLEDMNHFYQDAEIIHLNKSYRSTYEIIMFAKRIQKISSLEAVERHGDAPALVRCVDETDEINKIKREIDDFSENSNMSLGIIAKTNRKADSLYQILSKDYKINLISPESTHYKNGISITSVQMSKGLEFDQVIIPAANEKIYTNKYDRNLLFIACTRAMHKLTLTYTGRLTPLIEMQ